MEETQQIIYPRIDKKELSFTGIPLSSKRHKIHRYPAMLHSNLVDSLINEYVQEGDIVFDPFCGRGGGRGGHLFAIKFKKA